MKLSAMLFAIAALLFPLASFAHEVRPAYLNLREERDGEFSVLWKTPMVGDMRLALDPAFSGETESLGSAASRMTDAASVQTWRLRAPALRGQTVRIVGLDGTLTDALVRITFATAARGSAASLPRGLSRRSRCGRVPSRSRASISRWGSSTCFSASTTCCSSWRCSSSAPGTWRLVKAVTAFTAAHSITLGLATLGMVHVPWKPVEAIIALSIVYLAGEIVHARGGRTGTASKMPWIVAFTFVQQPEGEGDDPRHLARRASSSPVRLRYLVGQVYDAERKSLRGFDGTCDKAQGSQARA